MKYLAPIIAAIAPLALAALEHHYAQEARAETVEVAEVLSNACARSFEAQR